MPVPKTVGSLYLVDIASNTRWHSSIGTTPFEAAYKHPVQTSEDIKILQRKKKSWDHGDAILKNTKENLAVAPKRIDNPV